MIQTREIDSVARENGASLCGSVSAGELPGRSEEIERILPGGRSVVVLAAPHSRTAVASKNVQVAQYDTMHAYGQAARASHAVALWLESKGHRAAAVPAFIPIDMSPPGSGMVGAIDWREAGVKAGLGVYGESGLLVTKEHGPAIRLGGVVTDADIVPGEPRNGSPCIRCRKCVDACPSGALSGEGRIDKRKCGEVIFSGGFRAWRNFLVELVQAPPEERKEIAGGRLSLDLWQNFMTGNYYYCFACQAACPVGMKVHA